MQEIMSKFESPLKLCSPGGRGTVVAFCGRLLALGWWNLQMSWCKCPGVPRGQPPWMAADKCITEETISCPIRRPLYEQYSLLQGAWER